MSHLIERIRKSVIGEHHVITTPFGKKPLVYADYTASGRGLTFIEQFIQQDVLPYYANTHSDSSYTGAQTNALREQAREYIRKAVNANSEHAIIFCGSGATAAVHKLIDILNMRLPADLNDRYQFLAQIPQDQRPVVFIGPYEHHSNELPWRESIADVVTIGLSADGSIDETALKQSILKYKHRPIKMASFSAASNVTGIKTGVDTIARTLHENNIWSFWDYAAGAPYMEIDMCKNKDAVFISTHKFIGGPSTPGILVINKALMQNRVPSVSGGGTVVYVSPEDHRYSTHLERREEAGTPAIIETIRAGLVFRLQQSVGLAEIEKREAQFVTRALDYWQQFSNIEILGNTELPRLAIFSFRIMHNKEALHYGFIVALLNDLFGIQARGGCSCAGPYGHHLLGLTKSQSQDIEQNVLNGDMQQRPGWIRLNFNYFIDEDTFSFILQAISLLAEHAWRLLPLYSYNQVSNTWVHNTHQQELMVNLHDLDFSTHLSAGAECQAAKNTSMPCNYQALLKEAQSALLQSPCSKAA